MNRSYVQGFVDKCAAYGVDPEALLKLSQEEGENPQVQDALPSDQDPNRRDNAAIGFNVKNWAATMTPKSKGRLPFRSETSNRSGKAKG